MVPSTSMARAASQQAVQQEGEQVRHHSSQRSFARQLQVVGGLEVHPEFRRGA